jgi:hypothetical protein
MAKLDRLVNGIIIASDSKGRNKVRFCDNVKLRTSLLTKQGFTIHDIITSTQSMSRSDMLRYALDQDFDHDDSENLVKNLLFKYDQESLDNYLREERLRQIANRPKRDTDLTVDQVNQILDKLC